MGDTTIVAAFPGESDIQTWKMHFPELFGKDVPPTTGQALSGTLIVPSRKRAKRAEDPLLARAVPVLKSCMSLLLKRPVPRMAYIILATEPLDEEVKQCWPLSAEIEGPPGPELADFKQFHHQIWKMFKSAEDLMSDEYLEVCSARSSLQIF